MENRARSSSTSCLRKTRQRLTFCVLVALLGAAFALDARAEIDHPVRDIEQLTEPQAEVVVKLKNARVVIADYALIRRDFAETRAMSEEKIDQWLIDSVGYLAKTQTAPNAVNTKIETEKSSQKKAYRPHHYHRALVFKAGEGFIDVKGAGSLAPRQESHGNGLATTYEAFREFVFEKKVQQIFADAKLPNKTVGGYAVLDYGFNIIHNDGTQSPAGAILRQAHTRFDVQHYNWNGNDFLDEEPALKIEMTLRRYGVTSSGEGYWRPWGKERLIRDVINIQGNDKGEIVDFGPYRVRSQFYLDLYHYTEVESKEAKPVIGHKEKNFVQPNLKISLSEKEWGRPFQSDSDPKSEALGIDIKDLIQKWKAGVLSRETLRDFMTVKMGSGNYPFAIQFRQSRPIRCEGAFVL